jgi:hypothetical protein
MQPLEAVMGLHVRKAPLDSLSLITRPEEAKPLVRMNGAARSEILAIRTDVDAATPVPSEVGKQERAILAFALVPHRDVRRDLLLADQPAEEAAGAIGRIHSEPLGLQIKAPLGAIDHGSSPSDFVVGPGWRRLDIDDDRVLDIDEVVEHVAELHALVGLGRPRRGGIGGLDHLRGLAIGRG